ncbi:MAG: S-layer homology domain-containing protein, partial [Clostridia bacterium]|nr:S-layer homology domain-containing protein [Clostridia bacterium]
MKKIKSLALIAMIIAIMTATVSGIWAHSFADVDEFDVSINTLSSLGVIRGKRATVFSPNDNVTRWQMALMITKLSTGITDDEIWRENSGDFPFTDVKEHHYRTSVAHAAEKGIIIGTTERLFSPDQSITLQDGYTMACRILDYSGNKMDEGYPESYIKKAEQLGLSAGLEG